MSTSIGVLCTRMRVEEKQIVQALTAHQAVGTIVPPASLPIPPGPSLPDLAKLGATADDGGVTVPGVMIDRIPNRAAGRVMNRLVRHAGVIIIDGGLCSRRNRLEVASAWKAANLPRPHTLVGFNEATAIQAAHDVGFPCTLFPMNPGKLPTALQDHDTADAVVEHRTVLGSDEEEIVLVQHGDPDLVYSIHVVGDDAIACDQGRAPVRAQLMAVAAAKAIFATAVRIDIADIHGDLLIWNATPVTDFRHATLLTDVTMGEALAQLAITVAEFGPIVSDEEVQRVLNHHD